MKYLIETLLICCVLMLAVYFYMKDEYSRYCNNSIITYLRKGPRISESEKQIIFEKLIKIYPTNYLKNIDQIGIIVESPELNGWRNNGREYFSFLLHDYKHEIGVTECGDIEGVSFDLNKIPVYR